MKAVVQRVRKASVSVDGKIVGEIGFGLLVFVGIGRGDNARDVQWMADKIVNLRLFEKDGKFDESLLDVSGELLLVSQFTLHGDCSRGRRPSFSDSMATDEAKAVFQAFVDQCRGRVKRVETGVFQTSMEVSSVNDGPVTLIVDSRT